MATAAEKVQGSRFKGERWKPVNGMPDFLNLEP
jgi:hypothetical protein